MTIKNCTVETPDFCPVFLADYRPPDFLIDTVNLSFDIGEEETVVESNLRIRRCDGNCTAPLVLDGHELNLLEISIDGRKLGANEYRHTESELYLLRAPDRFTLYTKVLLKPHDNTSLQGLFFSDDKLCSHCEAEGFRKITFFLDRPDVLSRFQVKVSADRTKFPTLLSNGNLIEEGTVDQGRHFAIWSDPHPKPCYLFAIIAGKFEVNSSKFVTKSGRNVDLSIYSNPKDAPYTDHCMQSLVKAMAWDEKIYGLEYDLDGFNIAIIRDFNGAMENSSLNIYNPETVLFHPDIATDWNFHVTEMIVGHEYFHNWSGNRVTCRDWFQLSVKEGLTTFRQWQFAEDMGLATMKRIWFVRLLRRDQFSEDAGPLAHAVAPDSYLEITNFYTATVYKKGAEVIRMLCQILGKNLFQAVLKKYFSQYDGQAVTKEQFLSVAEDLGKIDLTQFSRWYSQIGTPRLRVEEVYDPAKRTYRISFEQFPGTDDQESVFPLQIPIRFKLFEKEGDGTGDDSLSEIVSERTIVLDRPRREYEFENIDQEPIPSVLRGFSAPVKIDFELSADKLACLMVGDDDGFAQWQAADQLATNIILGFSGGGEDKRSDLDIDLYIDAVRTLLKSEKIDPFVKSEILKLPEYQWLAEQTDQIDVHGILDGLHFLETRLTMELHEELSLCVRNLEYQPIYAPTEDGFETRALRSSCLPYLTKTCNEFWKDYCLELVRTSDNITDKLAALMALKDVDSSHRNIALDEFRWSSDQNPKIHNYWLELTARSNSSELLLELQSLTSSVLFELSNPGQCKALLWTLAHENMRFVHAVDGSGYRFLADMHLRLDELSPYLATWTGLLDELIKWRRLPDENATLAKDQLNRIFQTPNISRGTYERVFRSLN